MSAELLDDVRIAVTEACSSVITDGDAGLDVGALEIWGTSEDGQLVVAVRSREHGVAPRPDLSEVGLGVPLIGALTTRLEIGTTADGAHEVRMTFPRDGA